MVAMNEEKQERERAEERAYGLCEVVEVHGGEAEEIIAAEPTDGCHCRSGGKNLPNT